MSFTESDSKSSLLYRFIKEPWVGLKHLEKFLGISHEITEENFFFNATKVSSLLTFILISLLQKDSNIFFWALNFHGHTPGLLLRPSRDDRSESVSSRVDVHQVFSKFAPIGIHSINLHNLHKVVET